MCLGVPGKVVRVDENPLGMTMGRVNFAGITKDVSVGFYGGTYRCLVCGRDMRDYSDWSNYCPHWPGQKIAVKGADKSVCTVLFSNSSVSESMDRLPATKAGKNINIGNNTE